MSCFRRIVPGPVLAQLLIVTACALPAACSTTSLPEADPALQALPQAGDYCLAAERVVSRSSLPMQLVVHRDFQDFVGSKALIAGPTLQQFDWMDADGKLLGISCKLKSSDHLLQAFGPGSAGPDGRCQDMNRAVLALVARQVPHPAFPRVVLDPDEVVVNEQQPGMTGPDWLAPFTLATVDADGSLRIHSKGFIVDFLDPRFAAMPERFRGVHYCHFIAPDYLRALLEGKAGAGAVIGRKLDLPAAR